MLKKLTIRCVIYISFLLVCTSCSRVEKVLSPPIKIPFVQDVKVGRYYHGQQLELFNYTGKWEVKNTGDKMRIIGTSDDLPIHLISKDKLSTKPKSLKFDFTVNDADKEYGFVLGKSGVLITNNVMYPAYFDSNAGVLSASSKDGRAISLETNGQLNTLLISTGYDPLGGVGQSCTIYINGKGVHVDCPETDSSFGAYISPSNGITLCNFRWWLGGK